MLVINPIPSLPSAVGDTAPSGTNVNVGQEPTFDRPIDAPSRLGKDSSLDEAHDGGEIGGEVETVVEVVLPPPSSHTPPPSQPLPLP